jgi:hypothetical protein
MSGTTVAIKKGNASTQVSGAPLTAHTTLRNTDPNNAVWLSSSPAVTPNNGMKLGPLGSLQWVANALCWGCVDTGVVSDVLLNYSDDVDQVNDPLAIAIATSTELLANGIPNVLISTPLLTDVTINAGTSSTALPTSQFASLIITALDMSSLGRFLLQLDWGGGIIELLSSVNDPLALAANSRSFVTSVKSSSLTIKNLSGTDNTKVSVTGTNRVTSDTAHHLTKIGQPRQFSLNNPTNGVAVQFVESSGAGGIGVNITEYNGPIWFRLASAAIGGLLGMKWLNLGGTNAELISYVATVGNGQSFFGPMVMPPNACVTWWYLATATGGTTVSLDLIPGQI